MKTRQKIEPRRGDLFEIPLGDGRRAYGHVLGSVLIGFYAVESPTGLPVSDIINRPVAFRLKCMIDAIEDGRWPIMANIPPPPQMDAVHRAWSKKADGRAFLFEWTPETGGQVRWVPEAEVAGLEKNGIWSTESTLERLKMFLRGEPCPWVELG